MWLTPYHAYLAWVLSVECARRHYPDTTLVTDDAGAELLLNQLGLKFTRVSLELNRLHDRDADWWALGKLHAYSIQTEPFIHIDADAFLWKRLPPELESAAVFAQSPETFDPDDPETYYLARAVEQSIAWLPDEWRSYTAGRKALTASCCGILGGTRVDLITDYANLGIRVTRDERNAPGWATWGNRGVCNVLIEQMLVNAVVAHRRTSPQSPADATLRIEYLFPGDGDPYDPVKATAAGYTHLIGWAKRNPELMADLEARVCAEFPELAERCRVLV